MYDHKFSFIRFFVQSPRLLLVMMQKLYQKQEKSFTNIQILIKCNMVLLKYVIVKCVSFDCGCIEQVQCSFGTDFRWLQVALSRWLYQTGKIQWKNSWEDLGVLSLNRWLQQTGLLLSRFDCIFPKCTRCRYCGCIAYMYFVCFLICIICHMSIMLLMNDSSPSHIFGT